MWLDLIYSWNSAFNRLPLFMRSKVTHVITVLVVFLAFSALISVPLYKRYSQTPSKQYDTYNNLFVQLFPIIAACLALNLLLFLILLWYAVSSRCFRVLHHTKSVTSPSGLLRSETVRSSNPTGSDSSRLFQAKILFIGKQFFNITILNIFPAYMVYCFLTNRLLDSTLTYVLVCLSFNLPIVIGALFLLRIQFVFIFPMTSVIEMELSRISFAETSSKKKGHERKKEKPTSRVKEASELSSRSVSLQFGETR